MWWHSSCSSLIFKILLFGRYNLHNIGWLAVGSFGPFAANHSPAKENLTFWSLFQALCPLFQSGTLPRLCPGCLDKVHLLSSPHGVLDVLRVESDKEAKDGEEHHAVGGQHKATRSTIDLRNKLIKEMMMVI